MRDTKERVVQVELPKKVGSSSRSSNVYSPKMCLDGLEEGFSSYNIESSLYGH